MSRILSKITAWLLYGAIVGLYGFSLWALVNHSSGETLWTFAELGLMIGRILQYSLLQAGLSAILSTLLGVLLARSFFYLHFNGKAFLYKMFAFVWALPSLVVIFALLGVWGNGGWLAQISQFFGWEWQFQIYGLHGILLAHCFCNIPLVTKYALEGLQHIPSSQHRLAAQLNLRGWHYFRIVELPMLKNVLPYAFINVFLLCFTSFPIILMLGGSPKYSTLEVAIFQAVTFEFDFAKAVMLIAVQLLVGIGLQLAMDLATKFSFRQSQQAPNVDDIWRPQPKGGQKWFLQAVLFLQSFAIFLPLASVVWAGVSVPDFIVRLQNEELWRAFGFSLGLSLIASVVAVAMAYLIALESRQLAFRQQKIAFSILGGVATYPLILPIFLLAVGLFLLFMEQDLATWQLLILVGVCNGLTLLPYLYRLIFTAMWQALTTQDKLARSLGLTGFKRWWIVERTYLARPLLSAFALAMSSSLGSFAVIAFFGNPDFSSLPYLLYQQLGSYRTEDAAVTALLLMLTALLPFLFVEKNKTL